MPPAEQEPGLLANSQPMPSLGEGAYANTVRTRQEAEFGFKKEVVTTPSTETPATTEVSSNPKTVELPAGVIPPVVSGPENPTVN